MRRLLTVAGILALVVALSLVLSRCLADDPTVVVATTRSVPATTLVRPTTTVLTPTTVDNNRAKYLANVKALKTRLDKAAGKKVSLKTRLAAVSKCHEALNRVAAPAGMTMAGFHARSGCVAAGGARVNFAAAIKYTKQKDRAGRAAVAKHTKAGMKYLAKARAEFAKALGG